MTAGPERTCAGCRTRRAQPELQRFVRRTDGWVADRHRRGPGRGTYLCGTQCARAVIKNKRFPGLGTFAVEHYELQDTHMND